MSHRFINQKVQSIQPSGIRKFFDIANEIEDVISLGVGNPILIPLGMCAKRGFTPFRKVGLSIRLTVG